MKYAQIIPLIGGLPLGMKEVFGTLPEYVLSYEPFQNNDKHYINYLRKHGWNGDYILINEKNKGSLVRRNGIVHISGDYIRDESLPDDGSYKELKKIIEGAKESKDMKLESVDVVGCVAPCAGLSSLSTTSSADSSVNDWMYKSASFVLENIRPKIFWR